MTSDLLRLISPGHADSDLVRYLGITVDRLDADGAFIRIPPTAAAQAECNTGHIDDRALVAIADHCAGLTIQAALDKHAPLATVSLTYNKFRPTMAGEVFLRVGRAVIESRLAFVTAWLSQDDVNRPIGHVSARYIVGAWPGGGAMELPPPLEHPVDLRGIESFASFSGLPSRSASSLPFSIFPLERTVGARAVPAFHGGIVAAGLTTAAATLAGEQRGEAAIMTSFSIEYLRVALATQPLNFEAELTSSGRSTIRIHATARQGREQKPIAQALALFDVKED